jgi:cobalt-zinc-cadmium efflux system protein
MDAVALCIALGAQWQAARPATQRQTFGFARMEILAALANGALLLTVTTFIVIGALRRFMVPEVPSGALMIGVAVMGGVINGGIGVMLSRSAGSNLNAKAALYHVMGDMLGAFAVVIGGIVVLTLGFAWIDPALSLFVALLIVLGVLGVMREATDILLESTPAHVDVVRLREAMCSSQGVLGVHDLHVWTIGACRHALCAHVLVTDEGISETAGIIAGISEYLRRDFDITHVTLQLECKPCALDDGVDCIDLG